MLIERVLRRVAARMPRGVRYLLGGTYANVLREYTFAGADFLSFWNRLRRTEWASREDLERLQWRKFKVLLAHAYRSVPFYRRRFAEAGVTPDDIVTHADLVRIPPLRREDVRRHPEDLLADGVRVADLFLKKTSGSTGDSLHVYHDRSCYVSMRAAVARWRTLAGCDPFRSRVAATGVYGPARPSERRRFTRYDPVHHVLYLPSTTLNPETLREYVAELRAFRPHILQGVASTFYAIACHMKERGMRGVRARAVLPSGDHLLPRHRELLESVFGAPVYDTYGMIERTASAAECSQHEGMHLDMELCLV
ncbi:MAG TPA: hypothetical protein VMX57_07125, partial [Planctomycetota bacterium]|nr:hypothetical protein [Planctomycetota bacterium]